MAFGSFNAVYEHILQALLDETVGGKSKPDRITKEVLWCVGAHCDPFNETWIGPGRISDKTHYSLSSVLHALQKLCDRDWMRVEVAYNIIKRRHEHIFQLSPEVRFVRESDECNLLPEVIERFNLREKSFDVMQFFTKESQLDISTTKSSSKSRKKPDQKPKSIQNHDHHQSKPGTGSPDDLNPEGYDANASDDDQRESATKTNAKRRKNQQSSAAAPAPLPTLAAFGAPLEESLERKAARLVLDANCPIQHARRLVSIFDAKLIAQVIADLKSEAKAGTKHSSFYGLLEYRVRRGIVGLDERQKTLTQYGSNAFDS